MTNLRLLYQRQEGKCGLCGESLEKEMHKVEKWFDWAFGWVITGQGKRPKKLNVKRTQINIDVDHIVPKSKGGSNDFSNLQVTHKTCNNKKGNEQDTKKA